MCEKIHGDDIRIRETLCLQWEQSLDGLEHALGQLLACPAPEQLVDAISKPAHQIKLGASLLGLSHITRLCDAVEQSMEGVGEGRLCVDEDLINALLLFPQYIRSLASSQRKTIAQGDGAPGTQVSLGVELDAADQITDQVEHQSALHAVSGSEEQPGAESEWQDGDMGLSDEVTAELAQEIKEQFYLECLEHVGIIEDDCLVRLADHKDDTEAVNQLFRSVHTVKGAAGLFVSVLPPAGLEQAGAQKFLEVVHHFEDVLALIRENGGLFDQSAYDLCLAVTDYIKTTVNAFYLDSFHGVEDASKAMAQAIALRVDEIEKQKKCTKQDAAALPRETAMQEEPKPKASVSQSIRVNQEKIDKMMNMISELIIAKNSFSHISSELSVQQDSRQIAREVKRVEAHINRISDELQNAIMSIRMVEIKTVFQKLPRIVRDISQSTGKQMELLMEGESTEIDKSIIEQISDPLVHLIRNSADHGVEAPQDRVSKGKPPIGRIVLRAYNKNNYVFIEIEDDGKGIDPEQIKKKALANQVITEEQADKMSPGQLINLIFLPGFSMAKQVTEVSGRGVGMDIVKSNITSINGSIHIESQVDRGTKMTIRLPLSLAVSRGLIVESGNEAYIFLLEHLVETVKIKRENIHGFAGLCFTHIRGAVIGLEWLCKAYLTGERNWEKEEYNAIIVTNGVENFAFIVDRLCNEQEFVMKTLEGHLHSVAGISGITILGNGQVVLVANAHELIGLTQKETLGVG